MILEVMLPESNEPNMWNWDAYYFFWTHCIIKTRDMSSDVASIFSSNGCIT